MDNKLLESLEKIIELEETCYTQEKLIKSMGEEIEQLAIPKKLLPPPEIKYTPVPSVPYDAKAEKGIRDGYTTLAMIVGTILGGCLGYVIGDAYGNAFAGAFVGVIVGYIFIGAIIGAISAAISNIFIRKHNNKVKAEAKEMYERNVAHQKQVDEIAYSEKCKKYNALVDFERNRLQVENAQKRELFYTKEETLEKSKGTRELLNQLYDFAGIYETYRNIVAVCHIYEYLKSGICSGLSGRDGAYMIFKYEMYEKMKIERLDTIATQMEQIHFDNLTLNRTMESVGLRVDSMIDSIDAMRREQMEAAERGVQAVRDLGYKIDSAANRIVQSNDQVVRSNEIIAYNQQCQLNEQKHSNWLKTYELTMEGK